MYLLGLTGHVRLGLKPVINGSELHLAPSTVDSDFSLEAITFRLHQTHVRLF